MTSDLRKLNRKTLEDFITTYRDLPCLWNTNCKSYRDRKMREAAYDVLLKKYQVIDANADRDDVVKKINCFRTNYRKERKKVIESLKSEEVYEPSLWYYNLFQFLEEMYNTRIPSGSFTISEADSEEAKPAVEDYLEIWESDSTPSPAAPDKSCSFEDLTINLEMPRNSSYTPTNNLKRKHDSSLETMQYNKVSRVEEGRFDILGKNVALRMKDISDSSQRLIAEHIINEALFMAEMGQLTMSTLQSLRGSIKNSSAASDQTEIYMKHDNDIKHQRKPESS